jgi:FixJ family two-component response regulator
MFRGFEICGERCDGSVASSPKPTVFVVNSDRSICKTVENLVEAEGWRARNFDTAGSFFDYAPEAGPSCLILGIDLPDLNGLDVQRRIAVSRIDMPVIFATGHDDVTVAVRAMKAGALDFLSCPVDNQTLQNTIEHALDHSRNVIARETRRAELRDRYASLSTREHEVMNLVVQGRLNKQIGFELRISEVTVKAHRGQMMRKMRALSIAELVGMAVELELILPLLDPVT